MGLIHSSLSNLEIETHHPHSSSCQNEGKEETIRNWLELPEDVRSLIFLKLGAVDILGSAQWVCTSWWKLSKQPHLFCSIHMEEGSTLFVLGVPQHATSNVSKGLVREAIDRSCGQLVEFSVKDIANDEILQYMSEKSSSLRCLRLVNDGNNVTNRGLIKMAKKLPQLEELEIVHCSYFSKEVFKPFPILNYLCEHVSGTEFDRVVQAIAENMSELCHLNLSGNHLTDVGLQTVIDGCPHLESLDLQDCIFLNYAGDLKERLGNIKVSGLPTYLLRL